MKCRYGILFLIVLMFFTTVHSVAQTKVLKVPYITQQPYGRWCAFTSVNMACAYYGSQVKLCEIVEWARQHIRPDRGTIDCCTLPTTDPCQQGVYISTIDEIAVSQGLSCVIVESTISLEEVKNRIDNDNVLIIQGNCGNSWHTMVIAGYTNGDLHYIDPWDGYHITSYNEAVTTECLGAFKYRWKEYTHIVKADHQNDVDLYNTSSRISIYPNPTTGHIWVEGLPVDQCCTYKLTNSYGALVQSSFIKTKQQNCIELKSLPKGVYFLQLMTEKDQFVHKVILQ